MDESRRRHSRRHRTLPPIPEAGHGGAAPAVRREVREVGGAPVGWVILDNEAKLNTVDSALCRALADAVSELAAMPDLRALVLAGAGERAFVGGADVGEMVGLDPDSAPAFIGGLRAVCAALRAAPVPAIARIAGYCLGGGLEIAAACDFRIAARGARFGMPEVKVGVPSVIDAALLPDLIGWGRTRMLVYTGETIDAGEALAWGLVERLVPADALDDAVARALGHIVAAGPRAVRAQKALVREWERLPREAAIEAGKAVFAAAYRSDEPRRLMRAFLDRPRP